MPQAVRLAILGFDGLGKEMARLLPQRPDFQWVAVADRQGYAFNAQGLALTEEQTLNQPFKADADSIVSLLKAHGQQIDAVFMALPDLPLAFFSEMIQRITQETRFAGVLVDALKRTEALEPLFSLNRSLQDHKMLYITGAGAAPGFLTSIAAVAAHSFVEVLDVNIHLGMGVANEAADKATVQDDFIHLDGLGAKRMAAMSDQAIAQELQTYRGLLPLNETEPADDLVLELAGICPRDRVRIGGLIDTRNPKRPVSHTVTITGRMASGSVGSHQFVMSDETAMIDMVCGPALGFILGGMALYQRGFSGLMTSAEVMPRFAIPVSSPSQALVNREAVLTA